MNLRQLRAFQMVGRLGSVTAAANHLNIAQPALTRHLKDLQVEVGLQLLEKQGRGIALTEAGLFLYRRCDTVLLEYDRLLREIRAFANKSKVKRFSLGLPFALAQLFGASLVGQIKDHHDIDIRLFDGWTGFIIDWLAHGRIDIGLVYDPLTDVPATMSEPIAFERQYLVCRPDDPILVNGTVTLQQASELRLVLPSRGHGLRRFLDTQFDSIGCNLVPISEMDSIAGIKTVVFERGAYSILSKADAESDRLLPLKLVEVEAPILYRQLYLAWSQANIVETELSKFVDVVRCELLRQIEVGVWKVTHQAPD